MYIHHSDIILTMVGVIFCCAGYVLSGPLGATVAFSVASAKSLRNPWGPGLAGWSRLAPLQWWCLIVITGDQQWLVGDSYWILLGIFARYTLCIYIIIYIKSYTKSIAWLWIRWMNIYRRSSIELLKHGSPSGEAATVNKNWFALRPDTYNYSIYSHICIMCTTLCTVYRHDTYIYTCVSIFMCIYIHIDL